VVKTLNNKTDLALSPSNADWGYSMYYQEFYKHQYRAIKETQFNIERTPFFT